MGLPAENLSFNDLPHYTYEDYKQWEGNWEIINGIPYAMVPAPNIRHQDISLEIASQLRDQFKACGNNRCRVHLPIDWQVTNDTVVQPDVMVVCGENKNPQKLTITPVLVVEVLSPSSRRKDKALKFRLYLESGVRYYCVVDPETNTFEIFQLKEDEYNVEEEFKYGKISFQLGGCPVSLDFEKIFKIVDGEAYQ